MNYDKIKIAKTYLISVCALLLITFAISFAILYTLNFNPQATYYFNTNQILLISLAAALIPAGSYTGFCMAGFRIKEMSKMQLIAFCFLFIVTLLLITLVGIVMILPSIIKAIIIIAKSHTK